MFLFIAYFLSNFSFFDSPPVFLGYGSILVFDFISVKNLFLELWKL